jgi:hypothetical protein
MGCVVTQWWEGEGERPYVIHRARCIWEDCRISLEDAGLVLHGKGTAHGYLRDRLALPSVELVGVKEGREEGQGLEAGEKGLNRGGEAAAEESVSDEEEEGVDEGDVAAMLEYVIEEMQPHLYTELLMGLRHG